GGRALGAMGEVARHHKIDVPALKSAALLGAAAKATATADSQYIMDMALRFHEETMAADNFAVAKQMLEAADKAGRQVRSIPLIGRIERLRKDTEHAEKEFERVKPFVQKLAKDPEDAAAL